MLVRTSGHPPERLAVPAVPAGFVGSLGVFDPTHGPAARKAEYAGLLHGLAQFDRHWDPWAPATRGEAAQLLWNLLWLQGGKLAWAAREGTEQVVSLRNVPVPGSLGEPDTPARIGGLR